VTSTSPTNLTSGYHTYGLLWQPGSLTWYLDGRMVDTYKGANVPSQPMYFLANLAIDGRATSGSSFDIKSVKIYK
jgi:beta-glucanase (GH16 family)